MSHNAAAATAAAESLITQIREKTARLRFVCLHEYAQAEGCADERAGLGKWAGNCGAKQQNHLFSVDGLKGYLHLNFSLIRSHQTLVKKSKTITSIS